jgi:transposase-like protein
LNELMGGRLRVYDAKSELVRLATRLIVEEGLEAEVRDALGRGYYEHGAAGGGHRNGVRAGHLKTAEGRISYAAPQVSGTDEPFRSELRGHLKGHSEALEDLAIEMLARGLSVRDIEDVFKDESGRLLLSRTASQRSANGSGRTIRTSLNATSRSMTSPISSLTASPSACGRASGASRCWRPGASAPMARRSCLP